MRTVDPELQKRRRHEIVGAATRCFLDAGFHQTSMQDIARASGVSMGLIYRYFASKEALIAAAADVDREGTLVHIAAVAAAELPVKALEIFAVAQLTEARQSGYVALVAEVFAEGFRNPKVHQLLVDGEARIRAALAHALSGHQRAKRVNRDVDIDAYVEVFLATLDGLAARAHLANPVSMARCMAIVRQLAEQLAPR